MSKDPAFLFYHQDFFTGVSDMSNEEVGAYVRCLCIQASKGGITEKHMKNICYSSEIHNEVKNKFTLNAETNLFENKRLKDEIEKRRKYSESRSNNRKGKEKPLKPTKNISKTYVQHMENEDENEIENKDEEESEKTKKEKSEILKIVYPFENQNFISQWILWKDYKSKEFKFKYKSLQSEQASLKSLATLSNNNQETAIKIIHQSMSNGWKGFFELKKESNGQQSGKTNAELFNDAMQSDTAKNFRFSQ